MTQREALLAIARRNDGLLTPSAVIEEARDENSVLHGAFTWDDTEAAAKWRIYEAQKLIRDCRITIEVGEEMVETYTFVGLSTDRNNSAKDNPYRLAQDVAASPNLTAIAENDAKEQLRSVKKRYGHISSLKRIWDDIDHI